MKEKIKKFFIELKKAFKGMIKEKMSKSKFRNILNNQLEYIDEEDKAFIKNIFKKK